MSTYSELQAKVLRRVIDAPQAVQAEVPSLVNAAIRKAQQRHNYMAMQSTVVYTTTANSITLGAIPADFKQVRDYPFFQFVDGGRWVEMRMSPSARAPRRMWAEDAVGSPRIATFGTLDENATGNFIVFPLPDGRSQFPDGEYRVAIPYYRYLPDLVAAGDFNWFTTNGDEYIVDHATAEAFRINWDEKRANYWAEEAIKHYREMRTANAAHILGGMDLMIPFLDANQPDITE